jgi:hypothetical protein
MTSSLAGVPHATTRDDVYAGFFIPKGEPFFLIMHLLDCLLNAYFLGAFVIGNTW